MVKLVNNNGQYKLTVPKDIVLDRKWTSGTILRFIEDEHGRIYIKEAGGKK